MGTAWEDSPRLVSPLPSSPLLLFHSMHHFPQKKKALKIDIPVDGDSSQNAEGDLNGMQFKVLCTTQYDTCTANMQAPFDVYGSMATYQG